MHTYRILQEEMDQSSAQTPSQSYRISDTISPEPGTSTTPREPARFYKGSCVLNKNKRAIIYENPTVQNTQPCSSTVSKKPTPFVGLPFWNVVRPTLIYPIPPDGEQCFVFNYKCLSKRSSERLQIYYCKGCTTTKRKGAMFKGAPYVSIEVTDNVTFMVDPLSLPHFCQPLNTEEQLKKGERKQTIHDDKERKKSMLTQKVIQGEGSREPHLNADLGEVKKSPAPNSDSNPLLGALRGFDTMPSIGSESETADSLLNGVTTNSSNPVNNTTIRQRIRQLEGGTQSEGWNNHPIASNSEMTSGSTTHGDPRLRQLVADLEVLDVDTMTEILMHEVTSTQFRKAIFERTRLCNYLHDNCKKIV